MNITCGYCRATNSEDDQRCQRCGRRLHLNPPQVIGGTYGVTTAATARALRPVNPDPEIAPPVSQPHETPRRAVYQRSLFGPTSQVVPFETIAPHIERPRARRDAPKPRARGPIPGQQALDFMEPAQPLNNEVETRIYCEAPVAIVAHRIMAAAVDLAVIAIAVGAYAGVVQMMCGQIQLTKQTVPLYLGIAAVFALLYKLLWAFAGKDSPGMSFAHLRMVNFDGGRPNREQRVRRIAAGCLSIMAAGLGLMWALVDEESLTWHDRISKTFPTPW